MGARTPTESGKVTRTRGRARLPKARALALARLIQAGCDRGELLIVLNWVRESKALDNGGEIGREKLSSVYLRTLGTDLEDLACRITRFSDSVDGLNVVLFGHNEIALLPAELRRCRARVDAVRIQRDKCPGTSHENYAIAGLIAYVEHKTGKPHNMELGELLNWTPAAVGMWRQRHHHRIDSVRAAVGKRSVESPPPVRD